MADPSEVARIRAYLEQHKNTYTREALHEKLRADGADPAAIEAALAQLEAERTATNGQRRRFNPALAYVGLVTFVPLNVFLFFGVGLLTSSLTSGPLAIIPPVAFALAVLLVVGLAYWRRWYSFAAGLIVGYALMSIISGGTCTLLVLDGPQLESGFFIALVYYPLALIVLGIALGIYSVINARRRS